MAFSLSTNRLAKDFNRALHLNFVNTVTNYKATIWDNGVGSGTSVVDTNGGAKDALCTTFENTWNTVAPWVWSFIKNAANPLIAQATGTGTFEFYPPYPLKDGTNYRLCAKCNGDGFGYTSTDGITWISDGKFLSKGTSGEWDESQSSPNVIKFINGIYYIFYSGYPGTAPLNHKIGLATNSSWNSSFVKNTGNPIYDSSHYNNKNGTNWDGISVTDIILVGNQYYYFGTVYSNTENSGALCYGVGSVNATIDNIVLDTKICDFSDLNAVWNWAQGLSVFKHPVSGKWMMTFTLGTLSNSGTDNQAIYLFASQRTDVPVFTIADFYCKPIMYPDISKNYEDNYNYALNWLKDDSGNLLTINAKYCGYYSGHQSGVSPTYTGVTCLATCTSIPQI